MGPPGAPFRLGPGAKCPSCPPPVGGPGIDYQHSNMFLTAGDRKDLKLDSSIFKVNV